MTRKRKFSSFLVLCPNQHCQRKFNSTSALSHHLRQTNCNKVVNFISVESIVRHCLMIPENNEMNGYHEIWDRDLWANSFV
jgi:hypothetical protein